MIVSGFPAIGKSSYAKLCSFPVLDSDSSSWPKDEAWPRAYLEHINHKLSRGWLVLTSSHEEVRHGMERFGLPFTLVYPEPSLREEYRQRMVDRGSPPALIAKVCDELWDDALASCRAQKGCRHVELKSGMYLSDLAEWLRS